MTLFAALAQLEALRAERAKLAGMQSPVGGLHGNGELSSGSADKENGAHGEARLAAALARVERLAANNRVLVLELEEARAATSTIG